MTRSTQPAARFWSNLLGYQAVWFVAVIGAGHAMPWPGIAAGVTFSVWQLLESQRPGADLRLILVAIGLGVTVDGILANGGWAVYAAPAPAFPSHAAPLWILALWVAFSTTINRSLAYLRDRPALAALLGAVGAPLSYLGAQNGWHAVVFQAPAWRGLTWLGGAWAVSMSLLAQLGGKWARAGAKSSVTPSRVLND